MKRTTDALHLPQQRYEALRERARRNGLRLTPQRDALLRVLSTMRHHPTADELSRAVRRKLPSVSPATVYRNVQQLAAAAVITRLERASDVIRYDANPVAHHHFICTGCGQVEDVYLEGVSYRVDWQRTGRRPSGVTSCEVQLRGLCPECRG
jgi:Fe2+ or Zn2+ uptake regulation protein